MLDRPDPHALSWVTRYAKLCAVIDDLQRRHRKLAGVKNSKEQRRKIEKKLKRLRKYKGNMERGGGGPGKPEGGVGMIKANMRRGAGDSQAVYRSHRAFKKR
jgi:hypothetical protein